MKQLNIRLERLERKWSQVYVGQYVGISKVAVHDIETGKIKPSFDVLIKLLKLFEKPYYKDIEQLFAVADDENLSQQY